jgi:hypothetical protein
MPWTTTPARRRRQEDRHQVLTVANSDLAEGMQAFEPERGRKYSA